MFNIILNNNKGYNWFSSKGCHVKGFAFDAKNNLLRGETFIDSIIENKSVIKEYIKNLNGLFSIIIEENDYLFASVDKLRTFPLFYTMQNNQIILTDDSHILINNQELNALSIDEFLSCRFVNKQYTFFNNICQIEAGEYVTFLKNYKEKEFYYSYITNHFNKNNFNKLQQNFVEIMDTIIKHIIEYANGREFVLPLSGGYDSRIIATLLKKNNYSNILCYTYGRRDSYEVEISNKVAKELGFKWEFIEYNEHTIPKNYIEDKEFLEFLEYASNNVSLPHIQDYFAVKYMSENKIISNDAIFIPGHSGDLLGGTNLSNPKSNKDNIVDNIIKKQYTINNINFNDIRNKTLKYLTEYDLDEEFYYSVDDNYNIRERQSKFIVNSCRVYEFFGYQFLLPLWDDELVDFFKILPVYLKENSYFFEKVITEELFAPFNVDFIQEKPKQSLIKNIIKNTIKNFFPEIIKNKLIEKNYKDVNNFFLLTEPIQKSIQKQFPASNLNGILAYWYINKFIKRLEDE